MQFKSLCLIIMKNYILAILTFFIISCSNTPQERAEKNIEKYIRENLNDPGGYEKIEFGILDTLYDTPPALLLDSVAAIDNIDLPVVAKSNVRYKLLGFCVNYKFRIKESKELKLKYYHFRLDTLFNVINSVELETAFSKHNEEL